MSENWQQSELCIVINDTMIHAKEYSKHLSCDGLLYYRYVTQFVGERIFKICEHLAKLQAKWLIVLYTTFALNVMSSKMQNSSDK